MAELDIWMGGKPVGVLDGSDRRALEITYDERWLADPQATPLSVSLPLGEERHRGERVAAHLWGLLPDNEQVIQRWAGAYQCSASDVVGLLVGVGADVAGAAQYLPRGFAAYDVAAGAVEPVSNDEVAALLRGLRRDSGAWHPNAQSGWSLAGAQPKLALAYDELTRGWAIPSGSRATTHILKPAIVGLDDHDLNEHLCLAAARALGLRAADSKVVRFGSEQALVVRRYDRPLIDGVVVRVHQEDFCQALGVHPQRKYQSDGGPTVDDLVGVLGSAGSQRDDIGHLLRAVAYNWLILCTDAHAKNYSLLLSGRQVRLAPLYDLASAPPYDDHPKTLRMAQKVGGEYPPTIISRRHWERLASMARVDVDELLHDIESMAARLPEALSNAVSTSDLTGDDRSRASVIAASIAGWATSCRSALRAR